MRLIGMKKFETPVASLLEVLNYISEGNGEENCTVVDLQVSLRPGALSKLRPSSCEQHPPPRLAPSGYRPIQKVMLQKLLVTRLLHFQSSSGETWAIWIRTASSQRASLLISAPAAFRDDRLHIRKASSHPSPPGNDPAQELEEQEQ